MKRLAINLNAETIEWKLLGNINQKTNQSKNHLKCKALLKELYPNLVILEEVPIPIRKNETLYIDFYLPLIQLFVEVNGQQHYSFNPHFHSGKLAFFQQKRRDNEKIEWAILNNIRIVSLNDKDDIEEWKKQLLPQTI